MRSAAGTAAQPEPWLRGPLAGVDPLVMPAAHALMQSREDIERFAAPLTTAQIWTRIPGTAATIGFHLKHVAGSIDRLLTYCDGRVLDEGQRRALAAEAVAGQPAASAATLIAEVEQAIDRALQVIRQTPRAQLTQPRTVGRAALPTTVHGLLFHIAEHTQRHTGQIITSAQVAAATA